jgi:hypothetical protein
MAWDMVQDDLPTLEAEVQRVLQDEDFDEGSEAKG